MKVGQIRILELSFINTKCRKKKMNTHKIISEIAQKKPNIALFGDLMLDHYIFGSASRISPEAPIQVVNTEKEEFKLGGAGNVANNIISLNSKVEIFSVIGDDLNSLKLLELLNQNQISTSSVFKISNRKTTIKSRVIAQNQQILRFDSETTKPISKEIADKILQQFKSKIHEFDLILISDYNKGVISEYLSQQIIQIANKNGLKVIIDPKGFNYQKYQDAFLVKPNLKELFEAVGEKQNKTLIDEVGKKLLTKYNFQNLIVTLSEDGIKLFTQKNILNFPTKAKKIFDVTGAGDTVLATLGVAIASNITLENSIELANIAAAVVIGKVGTATPTFTEIIQFGNQKILSWNDLKAILDLNRDKKIVFTNGCFDILHVGHLKYLEKAKELGDILVVAINSDSSVRKIKGEKRPINLEDDRAYLLSGLACVDYVTIFSEETPYKIIDFLKPNILVKGADYKNKEVVGSNLVDEVKLIEFVAGKSTTNIIDKICQKYS